MKEFRTAGATGKSLNSVQFSAQINFLTSLLVARETPEKVISRLSVQIGMCKFKIKIVILMNVGCGSSLIVIFLPLALKLDLELLAVQYKGCE